MTFWPALASALHLLSLALGLGGIVLRAVAFSELAKDPDNPQWRARLFLGDNLWGLAALFWIGSGLWRLLGGLEKPTLWYLNYGVFWGKMALFGLIFALEMPPMISLIKARILSAKQPWQPPVALLQRYALFSRIEAGLTVSIVFVAALMAHGWQYPGT